MQDEPQVARGKKQLRWPTTPTGMTLVGVSQVGLFVIVLGYALHAMKPVLLPLVLAVLVSLILHPVYTVFRKLRLPTILSAALTVMCLIGFLVLGSYQAVIPAAEGLRNMNEVEVLGRLEEVFRPVKKVQARIEQMAGKMEEATAEAPVEAEPETPPEKKIEGTREKFREVAADVSGSHAKAPNIGGNSREDGEKPPQKKATARSPKPVMVEIHEDTMGLLLDESADFAAGLVAFLLMVFFIFAYGLGVVERLGKNPGVAALLERMAQDVSRYLFTITIINACLGICIGAAMWGLGMPKPALWGLMAMIFNFIPYVGAMGGTMVVFLAAAVNFEQPAAVISVPVAYFVLTAIEGNLVTPAVLGGHFRINPMVVFVWIFAWAGFWGVAGMLIAMPALVIFKIVCGRIERMKVLRRVMEA